MNIGVDIGGMSIKVGLVNETGLLSHVFKAPTGDTQNSQQLIETLLSLCNKVREKAQNENNQITGIGFGVPGTVDNFDGCIKYVANIPGLNGVPLRKIFQERFDRSLVYILGNDASVAAFGESRFGIGKNYSHFVLITLGTGIGGGIILNKSLYTGCHAVSIEIGHMCIERHGELCGCGLRGCFEAYASVSSLIKQTKQAIKKYPTSLLAQTDLAQVNGQTVFESARKGCCVAQGVIDNYIDNLSIGIGNIISILQPEMIAIGGGLSGEGENLLVPLKKQVMKNVFAAELQQTEIAIAVLGNDAGIIGAACLVDEF